MQFAQAVDSLKTCSENVVNSFKAFLEKLGLSSDYVLGILCPYIYCVHNKDSEEVFCANEKTVRLAMTVRSLGKEPVSVGTKVGVYRRQIFEPSLALAFLIVDMGLVHHIKCGLAIIRGEDEWLFVHGMIVGKEGYTVACEGPKAPLVLVVGPGMRPLGWGKISKSGKLIPVKDIGWFVRAGY